MVSYHKTLRTRNVHFSLNFKIYTPPVFILWHAPPSGVHRRRPLQMPEAQATAVLGSRRVDGTRLNACRSSARVLATFHLFWPCTTLVGVYGGRSSAGWYRGRRVSSTRRRLRRIPPLFYCRQLLWVFLFSVYIPVWLLWITVCLFVMHKCSLAYLVSV
jgi:hypothetical protein